MKPKILFIKLHATYNIVTYFFLLNVDCIVLGKCILLFSISVNYCSSHCSLKMPLPSLNSAFYSK